MLLNSGLHTAPLRGALVGGPFPEPVQHTLFEKRLDQSEDATVRYLLPDQGKKAVFRDRVEVALQVGIDDVAVAGFEQLIDPPQRVLAAPSGAKAVAVASEVPLEDRLQHQSQCRLHDHALWECPADAAPDFPVWECSAGGSPVAGTFRTATLRSAASGWRPDPSHNVRR